MSEQRSFYEWLRQPETLIGLSAVLLSVCGLGIALYEASLFRQAQRASVWPHLEVAASLSPNRIRLFVVNSGVGPARVESAALSYRGERLAGWSALVDAVDPEARQSTDYYQSLLGGRVLAGNNEHEVVFRMDGEADSVAAAVANQLGEDIMQGELDIGVCYCSVYDECWTTTLQDMIGRFRGVEQLSRAKRVRSCENQPQSRI